MAAWVARSPVAVWHRPGDRVGPPSRRRHGRPETRRRCDTSGALDLAAARTTWALIADGAIKKQVRPDGRVVKSAVTNVELATATYALETFEWADDAASWFRERVEAVDKK